jgi:hypothetical protein
MTQINRANGQTPTILNGLVNFVASPKMHSVAFRSSPKFHVRCLLPTSREVRRLCAEPDASHFVVPCVAVQDNGRRGKAGPVI